MTCRRHDVWCRGIGAARRTSRGAGRFEAAGFAVNSSSDRLRAAMTRRWDLTGTHTPVTAAPVGPVAHEAQASYADSGVERVVLELPALDEPSTTAHHDEFVTAARAVNP